MTYQMYFITGTCCATNKLLASTTGWALHCHPLLPATPQPPDPEDHVLHAARVLGRHSRLRQRAVHGLAQGRPRDALVDVGPVGDTSGSTDIRDLLLVFRMLLDGLCSI